MIFKVPCSPNYSMIPWSGDFHAAWSAEHLFINKMPEDNCCMWWVRSGYGPHGTANKSSLLNQMSEKHLWGGKPVSQISLKGCRDPPDFLCPANCMKEAFPCLRHRVDILRKQISIYRCFQWFSFHLGQSITIQTLQNLIPFIAVSLGCAKGIVEIFWIYTSITESKALLQCAVNSVSYLLSLGLEWSL